MFADYPRFVRSAKAAGIAVFLGLALTAAWFMPLGLIASAIAGSADPGAMVFAIGIGWWGAVLLALATLTTNFVNIYMSALAFKSLRPQARDATAVWLIGGVGAALGLLSNAWIEQFAGLTLLLGVDRFMSEARAITNLIGNAVATMVVARWDGALDLARARAILAGHEPAQRDEAGQTDRTGLADMPGHVSAAAD